MLRPLFRSFVLCVFFWLLLASNAAGQYLFESWTTEQGLPYRTVNSVLQTRDGYIWAATGDGLARFDGLNFTVFSTANSQGLATNRLKFLAETADKSLWLSGEESGLFRYRNGEFTSYTTENGLPGNKILSLHPAAENRLRVLTERGVAVWQNEIFVAENREISIKQYFALLDNTGALCVKENGVVRRFSPGGGAIEYKISGDSPDALLTLVYQSRDGAFWIGTFFRKEPRRAKLYRFKNGAVSILSDDNRLPAAFINQILEDRKGNIWLAIGTRGESGLARIENEKIRLVTKTDGFMGNGVSALFADREGGIWAATTDAGLMRINEKLIASLTRATNNLSTDNVYPLYEDADGAVWAGAWRDGEEKRGGLDKYENGFFTNFAAKGQITSYLVTSIFKDRNGVLWIGAYDGLTAFKDGKFTRYTMENGFTSSEVYAITERSDGSLWFGTANGLSVLGRDGVFHSFTVADDLPHNEIKYLHESRDETLWIATRGGLASFKDGKITNRSEVPAVQIRSIMEDADGALWFGTYDAGIFRFKNGEFKIISVKDGLFDQGAFQILEDDFGRFWISSNRGIYRVRRQELNDFADGRILFVTSVAYGVKDGMADAECNGGTQPAGFKSKKDGTLWFPTQKGVVVINPKALPVNLQPPNVVIENCLLDRADVACDDVKISPDDDSLEIRYTGLSFTKSEQIKFRYRLEGLDENWVDAGTQRTAYFTHLPPGDYTFRVAAANVDGVWNETGASLKITVVPPFYLTRWFLSLALLSFVGFFALGYRLRVNHLKKANAQHEAFSRQLLESQEQERQRIAIELHDSLGQDLLIIKNWALLGLNQNGDAAKAKRNLNEISETASQAIEEVREIAYNLRPYQLDELGLTKAIESMCERMSHSSDVRFDCSLDDLEGFFPKDAEINFYRIVQECANNIVKHSEATAARILIERDAYNLRLTVEDNGKGFDLNETTADLNRRSLGLISLVERSRILGGKPVIQTALGEGTKISLHLQSSTFKVQSSKSSVNSNFEP